MEKHIKVSRAHKALSWFYVLAVILVAIGALPLLINPDEKSSSVFVYSLLLFLSGFCAMHHFISKGAKERKPWSRNASRIVALFMLLGFPIGTIIGFYLLMNNWPSQPVPGEG